MPGMRPAADKGRPKPLILIVEDEAGLAGDMRDALIRAGYDVVGPATRADEAIRLAGDKRPHLVLMEIRLKGSVDGIAAAAAIKQTVDTALVYVTSHADDATLDRARRTQPHGYLMQPFQDSDLRAAVEMALYRHETETRAAGRERWFAATLAAIADAVVSTDAQGRITSMNPAAERLTGSSAADAVGQRIEELFRPHGKEPHELDNITRPVLDDSGAVIGNVLVFRDVAERRRLERRVALAERVATAGTLAAGMAHEIANPLTYVLANVKTVKDELLLLGGPETAKLKELVGLLVEATTGLERTAMVARNLVKFAGTVQERRRLLDLHDVIEAAVEVVQNLLRHRAQVEVVGGPAPHVEAADHELTQVMVSLLINAVEALPGEREHNRIVVRTSTDEMGRAVVEVQDNGRGIPPDALARVFEPFFSTKQGRSGLGLTLSQRIARELGGDIVAASEPGRGATLRVTLPAARRAATPPSPARASQPRRRFLVIEDEQMVARALGRILGKDNEVVIETDPHLALARVARGELYDIIFCDVMMPKMSGRAVYQAVTVANAALTDRIVFITGGVFTRELEEFLASVKNPVLTKPFAADAIRELVAQRSR